MKVDIIGWHDAIENTLRGILPDGISIISYDPDSETFPTPCVLIDLEELRELEVDGGGDEQIYEGTLTLYCVLSRETSKAQLEVRNFGAWVMQCVHSNDWGCSNVSAPDQITAVPAKVARQTAVVAYAVMFQQRIQLPARSDASAAVPWLTAHLDIVQAANAPIAGAEISLPQ